MVILDHTSGIVGQSIATQARLVALDATGTPVANEGNALLPADVSTISRSTYDLQSTTPGTPVEGPTSLTVATALSSTLTADAVWQSKPLADGIGRNFLDRLAGTIFAVADHTYRIVYTLTTSGGAVLKWGYDHTALEGAPE